MVKITAQSIKDENNLIEYLGEFSSMKDLVKFLNLKESLKNRNILVSEIDKDSNECVKSSIVKGSDIIESIRG